MKIRPDGKYFVLFLTNQLQMTYSKKEFCCSFLIKFIHFAKARTCATLEDASFFISGVSLLVLSKRFFRNFIELLVWCVTRIIFGI